MWVYFSRTLCFKKKRRRIYQAIDTIVKVTPAGLDVFCLLGRFDCASCPRSYKTFFNVDDSSSRIGDLVGIACVCVLAGTMCMLPGIMCMAVWTMCMLVGTLCTLAGIMCMSVGIVCMLAGILCMAVLIMCMLDCLCLCGVYFEAFLPSVLLRCLEKINTTN